MVLDHVSPAHDRAVQHGIRVSELPKPVSQTSAAARSRKIGVHAPDQATLVARAVPALPENTPLPAEPSHRTGTVPIKGGLDASRTTGVVAVEVLARNTP